MKKSTIAVLLSAFLFPGAGHFYLKKYIAGVLLVSTSFAAIYYFVSMAIDRALEISKKIQTGDIPLDIEAITESLTNTPNGSDLRLLNIAMTTLIICWLIGIIDSYRAGCVRDKNDKMPADRET